MATGVKFGDYHTYTNFGLSLDENCPVVGSPDFKENYIDIPGGIPVDASDYPGNAPTYKRRSFSARFLQKNKNKPWPVTVSEVLNALHGKKMDIILDDDPAWRYYGRIKVATPAVDKATTAITVTASILPYKRYSRNVKDVWTWNATDFGTDESLYDDGLSGVNVGAESSTSRFYLPPSPCGMCADNISVSMTVTGFYGSATSGSIRIKTGGATTTKPISATGTHSFEKMASYGETYVETVNLVGSLTVDYTPRSL